ncbi:DUF4102 domain-containing protein [Roseateles saccharophilus]|uniref:Uncharacterized protein DUF4102 n=1 Tax=Roseateles saccharophilus TaxID=304 RepID=A0A4R3VIC1_ROSSA|nr:DUF4102 domain-containing protein [Roseateles saccharophilus]TCV03544.1 uncharacterized protein DUF4102 [Roseateles saccharophilus]
MLTDTALRNLLLGTKPYKITDRDGKYAVISPTGTVAFRYDYRLNGRRETLTIGRYGRDDISLAVARGRLADARRAVSEGRSPAIEKQREKRRLPYSVSSAWKSRCSLDFLTLRFDGRV